jgi:hypothetical protein
MLKLLSVMTGDNKYEIQINDVDKGVSMCTVAQNLVNIGEKKGKNTSGNRRLVWI